MENQIKQLKTICSCHNSDKEWTQASALAATSALFCSIALAFGGKRVVAVIPVFIISLIVALVFGHIGQYKNRKKINSGLERFLIGYSLVIGYLILILSPFLIALALAEFD